ncbi:MAG: MFS transporter [Candidatus Aenigmarchaeota archaeon]|nr:MFS transporter [Candidatus Aenigmarchaeota archaeon]
MGFYVRPEYFEVIHYYYFSIGIFSFMCAIIFGFSAFYSVIFILLYIGLSSFSWYTSWFMQKRMREFIIPNSINYAGIHVFFTLFVGGLTFGVWLLGVLKEELLITIILYLNYFVFFLAVVWYIIVKFGVVKEIFDVYDSRIMQNAKKLIIKTRESKKDIFTRTLVSSDNIKNYRTGSNPEIDELLLNAWREKKSQKLLKRITEIEIAFCNQTVERMRKWIGQTTSKGVITPRERDTITRYEQAIDEYAKASMEYEKDVVSRLPD